MEKKNYKPFEVHTNAEWRRLGVVAENWAPPSFDLAVVPEELHDLIPLARRWGISCDVTRHDAAEKASAAELAEVAQLLQGRHPQIYRWLYSRGKSKSEEARAFQALLVFEMEEANGPGIPSLLKWRIREFKRDPSEENRGLLRDAYDEVQSWSPFLKQLQPLEEVKALLDA
jgi:hypothetical protein